MKTKKKSSIRFSDIIIVTLILLLIAYTVVALNIFVLTGSNPDILTGCVFAAVTGEFGLLAMIKRQKIKTPESYPPEEEPDEEIPVDDENNNETIVS